MRVGFPSQVSVKKLCKQKLCKFVVHHVTSNQRFFTFQKHENVHFISNNFLSKRLTGKNNMMWSIHFNQKTAGVLLFRIYHIEMHVTNICQPLTIYYG